MLTRRGWAVAAVAIGGFAMATWFSARSLDAVVGPALLALAAGWLQFRWADQPELRTEPPGYGFAGESVTVSLDFDASTPLAATVRLSADEGLDVRTDPVETTVADGTIPFEIDLRARGVRSVGPVEVVAEDVLGVWRTTYEYPVSREVVVFPKIHRLTDAGELAALHQEFGVSGRDRFDQLREYERGDPLRDVHWKSSAKRADDDLVVTEFAASEDRERVELLAEADGGRMDDVAEAAASVAAYLLDAGFAVGLTVPGDRVEPGAGSDHRTELLTVLARTEPGTVGDARRERADVFVAGPTDSSSVEITVDGRTVTFDQLAGSGTGVGTDAGSGAGRDDGTGGFGGRTPTTLADGGRGVVRDEFDGGRESVADGELNGGREGGPTMSAGTSVREGLRDGLRVGGEALTYHRLAVGSVAVLMATYVNVLYHVTDIVGGTTTLTALVAGTLVAATLIARHLSPLRATVVAVGLLVAGLAGYYLSVPNAYLVAVSFGKVLADNVALLTGLSVLRMTEVGAWALGVAPVLVFVPWYLVLRRRYALAVTAGGAALVFFVLTGDAASFPTLVGALAATATLGFATLARRGGTPAQVDAIGVVLVAMIVLSSTVSVVPGGAASPILPGSAGGGTPTVEQAFVSNQERVNVVGSIRLSPKVRFTVESTDPAYWRVGAYDRYDGDGWIRTGDARDYEVQRPPEGLTSEIEQTVTVEAEGMDAMPAAWKPVRLTRGDRSNTRVTSAGSFDPVGTLREGESYAVVSRSPEPTTRNLLAAGTDYPDAVEERYLQLPGSSADRIRDRTDEITANATTPYEEAVAIEQWLETTKGYSLDVDRPDGNIAESFIFDMERGYCTYYATAMVSMLRSQDVPARFVVGYTPGQRVAEDEWVVRGLDSHAWVEVYFPSVGWVEFDPTPGGARDSAENARVEQAREANVSDVDAEGSDEGTWTPTTTESPDESEDEPTTLAEENGTTDPSDDTSLPGGLERIDPARGEQFEGTVGTVTPDDDRTAGASDSGDEGGNIPVGPPSREQAALGALALVGLLAVARRTGALGRLRRAVWLRWQPRHDPETDVARAFARLERLLADEHRERDPGETPREYLSAMAIRDELDDRAERVGRIYERVRYAGEVEDALAEEAVSLVDELVAERRGFRGR